MRRFDLSTYWRVLLTGQAFIAVGLVMAGLGQAALSEITGALVGSVSLVLLTFSCNAYVRMGLTMAQGANPAGGRFVRGLLLLSRVLLMMVLIGGLVKWRGFVVWAFIAGVVAAQISLVVSIYRNAASERFQEKSS